MGDAAIGGIVSQYREMITKKGDKMARFMLEDSEGTLEVIAFPKTQKGSDLMTECPTPVSTRQLDELFVQVKPDLPR